MDSILRVHPAMINLLTGCQQLGLKSQVADSLVQFLWIKRALLTGNDQTRAAADQLEPSMDMLHLWHWMLLNTSIRDAVHAMVGGDVPHSTETDDDTPPSKKRRLENAQEALRSFGFTVNEAVWSQPPVVEAQQVVVPMPLAVVAQPEAARTGSSTQGQQQQVQQQERLQQPQSQQHRPVLAAQPANVPQLPVQSQVPAKQSAYPRVLAQPPAPAKQPANPPAPAQQPAAAKQPANPPAPAQQPAAATQPANPPAPAQPPAPAKQPANPPAQAQPPAPAKQPANPPAPAQQPAPAKQPANPPAQAQPTAATKQPANPLASAQQLLSTQRAAALTSSSQPVAGSATTPLVPATQQPNCIKAEAAASYKPGLAQPGTAPTVSPSQAADDKINLTVITPDKAELSIRLPSNTLGESLHKFLRKMIGLQEMRLFTSNGRLITSDETPLSEQKIVDKNIVFVMRP